MSDGKKTIPIGTIICLTEGDYSSFAVTGHFRVVKEFDPVELGEEVRAIVKQKEKTYGDLYFDAEGHAEIYLRTHYLEPITDGIYELHLGDLT